MYDFLLSSVYKNVAGVHIIDSGKPGKNIGVFAITHGNEPIGLRIIEKLKNDIDSGNINLFQGKIYCIAVSLETYRRYLAQNDYLECRFIDYNMNRIYKKEGVSGYEYERFQSLKPIFDEIDVAIDIHSIAKDDHTMAICNKQYSTDAKSIFDTGYLLLHEDLGAIGSMIGYLLDQGKPAFGIECGNHLTEKSFKKGYENILSFLSHYEAIQRYSMVRDHTTEYFEFLEEIFPSSDQFSYAKIYSHFDLIGDREVFARDKDILYTNTYGHDIYIGLVGKKIKVGDGNSFLFRKL